jgi:hypothetical protein
MTANKLPTYTKAEAHRLEDIYLNGYKAEGLIGSGKVPANDNIKRGAFNVTPAGRARQAKATADKERAYQLLAQGHDTVKAVRLIMKRTDTPVRRYFRQLEKEGRIEAIEKKEGGVFRWQG